MEKAFRLVGTLFSSSHFSARLKSKKIIDDWMRLVEKNTHSKSKESWSLLPECFHLIWNWIKP